MFLKVGFVLTDMSAPNKGNIGCVPINRDPVWGEVPRDEWTARPTAERAILQPDGSVRSVKAILNADPLLLKAGTAVLFEQCWHSGLSNAENPDDRCVIYVQYARRFLQPMDPARYELLREQQPCSRVRQQLLLLPSDVAYLPNNRSNLYYPPKTLPLLERQRERGIPFRRHERHGQVPEGFVNKVVPVATAAQIDALIKALDQGRWCWTLSLPSSLNVRAALASSWRRGRIAGLGGLACCASVALFFASRFMLVSVPSRCAPLLASVGLCQLRRRP